MNGLKSYIKTSVWALPPLWKTQIGFWLLALAWHSPGCCSLLGSEPTDEDILSPSPMYLLMSMTAPATAFCPPHQAPINGTA